MSAFETTTLLRCSPAAVFDFLARPANLLAVTPPSYGMTLVEGPERLHLGAKVILQGRRWGVSQRIVSFITAFEPNRRMTDEQHQGPLRKWVHEHFLEEAESGTRMIDRVEFETPGGLLGFVLTNHRIEKELIELFAYRESRFRELLEQETPPAH
jgi:ligand-binding SRPBCC domain-containing protein